MKLFVLIVLLFPSLSFALNLSLEQAISLAQERSWDSFLQNEEHEKVMLQRRQVIATVLPQVSASSSYQNYLTTPTISGFSLNSTHQVDMGLNVRQKLFEFGGLGNSLAAAEALLEKSQYKTEQVQRYLEHETTVAYFSVLYTEQQFRIARESYQNAENNLRILRQSFSAGRAPRGDLLRLETDIVSRRSMMNRARTDWESSILALKELLKIENDEALQLTTKLEDAFPVLEKEQLREEVKDKNLDLKMLRQDVEYLTNASKVERADLLPKLGLFYNLARSGRSNSSAFGMDENVNTQVVGVELTWNIWDGGGSKARYDETKKDRLIANYALKKSEDKLMLELNRAINEYESIRSNLETDRQSLKLAQESFSLVQDLLKVGKTSITELNSTEGVLNSVKSNYALNLFRAKERLSLIHYLTNSRGI